MAVVQQPIKDHGSHHMIAKYLVAFIDGAVGADQHATLVIAAGDRLGEQMPVFRFQRQVAQLIDDQQFRFAALRMRISMKPYCCMSDSQFSGETIVIAAVPPPAAP
jgi:hypothetical protein